MPAPPPVRKAILPVAGFGTRVLPATKSLPKEMLPVVDRPALQYVVDEAREAGITHFVFVTGRNKGAIEDYFDRAYELEDTLAERGESKADALQALRATNPEPGTMSFVRQQSAQGLGHAVWCARDVVGREPFAVLLPDVLVRNPGGPGCLAQVMEVYREHGGNVVAVDPVPEERVSAYGVVAPAPGADAAAPHFPMSAMVEKPAPSDAPSNLKITGRYILQPEVLDLLADQNPGAGGEIQLTDAMARLLERQPFRAARFHGTDHDCGSVEGYFGAVLGFALDHPGIGAAARAMVEAAAD